MQVRLFPRLLLQLSLIILLGLPWVACRSGLGGGQNVNSSDGLLKIYCYYSGDEKYALDQEQIDQSAWLRQFAIDEHLTQSESKHYDLFTHKGGGPAGAEWNSDGAILVLCQIALPADQVGETAIALNGEKISPPSFRGTFTQGTIVFFEIPGDQWLSRLTPIKKKDYPLLYDSNTIENFKNQSESPLGVGEILKVRIEIERKTDGKSKTLQIMKAFHRATGE